MRDPWLSGAGVSDGVCGLKQGDEPGFGKSQFRECGRDAGAHVGRCAGQGQGGKRKELTGGCLQSNSGDTRVLYMS